ncbi:MAG: amidohydrolase [Acidimicrobiia bacterium]
MTVIHVDRIHGHPGADAIAFEQGVIRRIGRRSDMPVPDLLRPGTVLLPGLKDSHIHPTGMAVSANRLDVADTDDMSQLVDRLARKVAEFQGPVIAVGFDDERVREGRMPTRQDLDRVSTTTPIVVYRHCSHIASANSAALALAGVDRSIPDPEGGRVQRGLDGRPTGVLEETALTPLSRALAPIIDAPDATAVREVLVTLRRTGVVAVDAMVAAGDSMWCAGADELEVIASLGDDSPIAVEAFVICSGPDELRRAATRLDDAGPAVRFAGWKGFADGSLGARTAALRSPYHDDPSTSGTLVARNLELMAATAVDLGGRVAIHAIGDLAVEHGLDVAEKLGVPGTVRLEHASVADPDQVEAMAELGVVASVQPSFVPSDEPWLGRRLGPKREAWAYPFASMLAAGVALRGGSDAPIEDADPLVGIRDAVRDRPEGLTLDQAVDLYATTPLQAGTPATFVLCDGEPDDPSTRVVEVWQRGARTV